MSTALNSEKQIGDIVRRTVIESIQGVLTDPDFGLQIRDNIAKRLKKYSAKTPQKLVSFSNIKKKYL